MKKWNNVPCKLVVELEIKDNEVVNVSQDLPALDLNEYFKGIPDSYGELIFDLLASGYYQPMSMYGGPDHLGWPEEGDNSVELDEVYYLADKVRYNFSKDVQIKLYNHFYDQIQEVEVPEYEL